MPYILVTIPEDGMIRSEYPSEYHWEGERKVVHKESVDLDKLDGIRVFDRLDSAKRVWSGPNTEEAILALDNNGAAEAIWLAENQMDKLTARLSKWKGCYGLWPIRKLND